MNPNRTSFFIMPSKPVAPFLPGRPFPEVLTIDGTYYRSTTGSKPQLLLCPAGRGLPARLSTISLHALHLTSIPSAALICFEKSMPGKTPSRGGKVSSWKAMQPRISPWIRPRAQSECLPGNQPRADRRTRRSRKAAMVPPRQDSGSRTAMSFRRREPPLRSVPS